MIDDVRSVCPSATLKDESIARVAALLKEDRLITWHLAAERLIILKSIFQWILIEDLGKRNICCWFPPHTLTSEQREQRVSTCEELLEMLCSDKNYLQKIITVNESWRFSYDPETKRQNERWVGRNPPKLKINYVLKNHGSRKYW